jgi:hypothetical protein
MSGFLEHRSPTSRARVDVFVVSRTGRRNPIINAGRSADRWRAVWIVIAGGLFAGAVQGFLTVPGDPAATAQAIAAHESLWRWGIGVHLVYLAGPAIIMDVLLYRIFKQVQPTLALLALVSALSAGAVEGAALLQPLCSTGCR